MVSATELEIIFNALLWKEVSDNTNNNNGNDKGDCDYNSDNNDNNHRSKIKW